MSDRTTLEAQLDSLTFKGRARETLTKSREQRALDWARVRNRQMRGIAGLWRVFSMQQSTQFQGCDARWAFDRRLPRVGMVFAAASSAIRCAAGARPC
jgi:hypothetical protein